MEDMFPSVRLVRDSREIAEATHDLDLIRLEPGLHSEGASGPPLTGEAVADRDCKRIARDFQTKLPTVTGGISSGQRLRTLPTKIRDELPIQECPNREQPKA